MTDRERRIELEGILAKKKAELDEAQKGVDINNATQLALKLVLNGSYGAFANKHFVCFSNGVAAAITAQGRLSTQQMDKDNEYYWKNIWHDDVELHKKLGLTEKPNKITKQTTSYSDTDSIFVEMKPAMESCNWSEEPLKFVHIVNQERLAQYFEDKLQELGDRFGVKNVQNFELEQVAKSIIFLQKKMYVKNVVWEDGGYNEHNPDYCKTGLYNEPETNIQAKGIDIVRSSTPAFARVKIKEIIKYYFENPTNMNDRELVKKVKEIKNQFKVAKIEDISMSSSCSNYDQKVMDDQNSLVFVKGTHWAVKGAGLHNYLLNQNPNYKSKYNLIKSGQKIKLYYTTNPINPTYAFVGGNYPYEIASEQAPVDYDTQFEKAILNMVNRFNGVLGLSELKPKLTFTLSIF